ncbi:MAG: hypothetical protein CO182_07940 [Lysobacterales bacterium CG_4_9_14_3_um_filter_62_6]|nr:MAG: hypothetical protein CO182_07940 [Xanthomonadales bacterium CG_4_9_14_3_um_filter_62_6]
MGRSSELMVIDMNESKVCTLAQVREVLAGTMANARRRRHRLGSQAADPDWPSGVAGRVGRRAAGS